MSLLHQMGARAHPASHVSGHKWWFYQQTRDINSVIVALREASLRWQMPSKWHLQCRAAPQTSGSLHYPLSFLMVADFHATWPRRTCCRTGLGCACLWMSPSLCYPRAFISAHRTRAETCQSTVRDLHWSKHPHVHCRNTAGNLHGHRKHDDDVHASTVPACAHIFSLRRKIKTS